MGAVLGGTTKKEFNAVLQTYHIGDQSLDLVAFDAAMMEALRKKVSLFKGAEGEAAARIGRVFTYLSTRFPPPPPPPFPGSSTGAVPAAASDVGMGPGHWSDLTRRHGCAYELRAGGD